MNIVVRQSSGLGNQLFQYAAGRYLASDTANVANFAGVRPQPRVLWYLGRCYYLEFSIRAQLKKASYFDRRALSTRRRFQLPAHIARAARKIQVIRQNPEQFLFHQELQIAVGVRTAIWSGFGRTQRSCTRLSPNYVVNFR